MGKYLAKILEIRAKCKDLFEVWCQCLKECNLPVPKACSPEMFSMFKQLIKEYDVDVVKKAIRFFYNNYPQIQKLFGLKHPIPEFKSFYVRRQDIINHSELTSA